MKKSLCLLMLTLTGCATVSGGSIQTPAQLAQEVCPAVQVTLVALKTDKSLSQTVLNDIAKAEPIVSQACQAGATVDTSSLQSLAATAFPLIIQVAQQSASPSLADNLIAAQAILNVVLAQAQTTQGVTK